MIDGHHQQIVNLGGGSDIFAARLKTRNPCSCRTVARVCAGTERAAEKKTRKLEKRRGSTRNAEIDAGVSAQCKRIPRWTANPKDLDKESPRQSGANEKLKKFASLDPVRITLGRIFASVLVQPDCFTPRVEDSRGGKRGFHKDALALTHNRIVENKAPSPTRFLNCKHLQHLLPAPKPS